jgi:hypothetical protein
MSEQRLGRVPCYSRSQAIFGRDRQIHEARRRIDGFPVLRRSLRRREGGGSSIPGLYIVGLARSLAAVGGWEVAARLSVWCAWLRHFSSGGAVPRSNGVVLLASRCSEAPELLLAAPDPAWILSLKMVDRRCAAEPMDLGVTPPGAVNGVFPSAQGLVSSIQGSTNGSSGATPSRQGRRRGRGREEEGVLCNFLVFLGPFCKNAVFI